MMIFLFQRIISVMRNYRPHLGDARAEQWLNFQLITALLQVFFIFKDLILKNYSYFKALIR